MKKRFFGLLCVVLAMLFAATTYADEMYPFEPWYRDLGNGLVFYYRPEYTNYPHNDLLVELSRSFIEQGYPQTGLYRNGQLVYAVDASISMMAHLYFSDDYMSFLEVGWWVPISRHSDAEFARPAVRFFNQGELIVYYDVFDLVRNRFSLAFTVSHVQWDYQDERHHSQEANTLQVRTREGNTIIFDLTTGLILYDSRILTRIIIIWISLGAIVIAAMFLFIKHRKKKSRPRPI